MYEDTKGVIIITCITRFIRSHNTSQSPSHFIEVLVSNQQSYVIVYRYYIQNDNLIEICDLPLRPYYVNAKSTKTFCNILRHSINNFDGNTNSLYQTFYRLILLGPLVLLLPNILKVLGFQSVDFDRT